MMIAAAGLLTAASCSDFDDYNEAYVDTVNPEANATLWENITAEPEFSKFVELVKKAGFENELQNTRNYTVWAPVNSALEGSAYLDADADVVLNEFVKNHVADYSYRASGAVDTRLRMLNTKRVTFEGNGSYTFDGHTISKANIPATNGVLHAIDGVATYYPSVYEYLSKNDVIDSVWNYYKHYADTVLDEKNSVVGPVVNGVQTYSDSVMTVVNRLASLYNADLADEDSSYTFILPTNETWLKTYERIKPYYNYIKTTTVQDLESATGSTSIPTITKTTAVEELRDSVVKRMMMRGLIYSNNNGYNQWVEDASAEYTDTLCSTTRVKMSNPREILAQTVTDGKHRMSNGYAYIVDSIAAYPWETYAPELNIDPYYYEGMTTSGKTTRVTLQTSDLDPSLGYFEGSKLSYSYVQPSGSAIPSAWFYLPDVLSTTYNFYCVVLPSNIGTSEPAKVNRLLFDLSYCNANGTLGTYKFTPADGSTYFENDTTKADTIFIGQFTFPVSYYGFDYEYSPNIKVSSNISIFDMSNTVERGIRILDIILRPVEKDEYYAIKEQ